MKYRLVENTTKLSRKKTFHQKANILQSGKLYPIGSHSLNHTHLDLREAAPAKFLEFLHLVDTLNMNVIIL